MDTGKYCTCNHWENITLSLKQLQLLLQRKCEYKEMYQKDKTVEKYGFRMMTHIYRLSGISPQIRKR